MADDVAVTNKGILGWIERTGNRLPDPVFIFFYLIAALMIISIICAAFGVGAMHPTSGEAIAAESLISANNIQRLWVEMPATFTHFHPLGYVLVVMLGAGVAERAGLFGTAMSAAVKNAPKFLLTPMVALVAMIGNHAADAAYVVLIPLAGVLFAAAGRHPLAGIAAAFAGVSGGFSANISPGQLDALLFGITEIAAIQLDPDVPVNIAGNWWFILAMTWIFLPVIWFVTDRIIEPRLGQWVPEGDMANVIASESSDMTKDQRKGLWGALVAMLAVVGLWAVMTLGPGTPLIDEAACPPAGMESGECTIHHRLAPFYKSLVAAFFILFLAAGWVYGHFAKTIKGHRDVVEMMSGAMKDLGYYLVLAFAAAHFVAMFNWSNLGLISAIHGAEAIGNSNMPTWLLMTVIILFAALINLFVGSASAKWALLAPVLVPMLMLLGISPEGATAAYRVGDSATNIITPLMVYFPLILIYCQRYQKNFGLGSLTATMVPYSIGILITGILLMIVWSIAGWPMGPGAPMEYTLPQ